MISRIGQLVNMLDQYGLMTLLTTTFKGESETNAR